MASIRRYKDGRVAIIGDYSNGSPFVRQKWVRGEKRKAIREEGKSGILLSPMEIGDLTEYRNDRVGIFDRD